MLYEHLRTLAETQPCKPFLIEAESGRELSYRQTLAAVHATRGLLGDAPRRVALALPNGIANAVLWLSALSGGHTLVPMPPDSPAAERQRLIQRFAPNVLVVERREDAASVARRGARVLTLAECEHALVAHAALREAEGAAGRRGHVCLTTSGSTGEPKGVMLGERQIVWTAEQVRLTHGLGLDDCGLTMLPFSHVNAPVVSLCASLLAGGTVVIARRFSTHHFWEWVERYDVSWVSLVPTILAFLLQTERPAFLPGRLRFVRSASAPLPVVQLKAFERHFGIPVIETYGLTEAASQVTANPVPPERHKPGSVGRPAGVALRICEPRPQQADRQHAGMWGGTPVAAADVLHDVAPGALGEICVRGPSVIPAYVGDASPEAFQGGWFRTGDLGYQDDEGYVYITGRLREVIIRGGENIAPREVEEVLLGAAGVREAAVVGEPDALYGQQVVAYIVPADAGWSEIQEAALRAQCAAELASYKIPVRFVPVATLPRTRSGKVQRHLLQDAASVRVAG